MRGSPRSFTAQKTLVQDDNDDYLVRTLERAGKV